MSVRNYVVPIFEVQLKTFWGYVNKPSWQYTWNFYMIVFFLVYDMSLWSQAVHAQAYKSCVVKFIEHKDFSLCKIVHMLNLINFDMILYDYVREEMEGRKIKNI